MTIWEVAARERKAHTLADQLQALGVDSEVAPWLAEEAWESLALLTGVRPPSWRTRELVVDVLREREAVARRWAEMSDRLVGFGP